MTPVELLQQIGLNKYEAEAYYTLLLHGDLTGYEVGKHSHVPLSRSYEILERLREKGLALMQPGAPPRYRAQEPEQFLQQTRSELETTLTALNTSLTSLTRIGKDDEFWVVRGRQNILNRVAAMISSAQSLLALTIPADCQLALAPALEKAQERGCRVVQVYPPVSDMLTPETILVLRDESEALLGTITFAHTCQTIISQNAALQAVLHAYFAYWNATPLVTTQSPEPTQPRGDNWLAWEEKKQRRLHSIAAHRVA